jgi:hypothetical protein
LKVSHDLGLARKELKGLLRSGAKGYALYVEWRPTGEVKLPDFSKNMEGVKIELYIGERKNMTR